MSSSFPGNPNNFLPESHIFPEDDDEEYDIKLREYLNNISAVVNTKDSGIYTDEEVITGQQFLPVFSTDTSSSLNFREVFRKVIDFGVLPNAAVKSVAHGITTTQNFSIVRLYGTATNPGVSTMIVALPIPTVNTLVPGNAIELFMDATNINIRTTSASFIAFTRCFVVVEYIKIV